MFAHYGYSSRYNYLKHQMEHLSISLSGLTAQFLKKASRTFILLRLFFLICLFATLDPQMEHLCLFWPLNFRDGLFFVCVALTIWWLQKVPVNVEKDPPKMNMAFIFYQFFVILLQYYKVTQIFYHMQWLHNMNKIRVKMNENREKG